MSAIRCTSMVLAFTLCASASAQVTTAWTVETPWSLWTPGSFAIYYELRDATNDAAGNVVVTGTRTVFTPIGVEFVPFTSKFFADGSQWTPVGNVPLDCDGFAVGVSPLDDSVYTAGRKLGGSLLVQKRDTTGGLLWETPLIPGGNGIAPGCLFDVSGNVHVGASSTSAGMVLHSWTPAGTLRFSTPVGLGTQIKAFAQDAAGDLILAGTGGASIAKVSTAGVVQWAFASGQGSEIRRIRCDGSGNIYALVDGVRIRQFLPSGALGWGATLSASNSFTDLAVDQQGGVIATGTVAGRIVTRRFDSAGNLLWDHTWATLPAPYTGAAARLVRVDEAGNAIVVGIVSAPNGPSSLTIDLGWISYTPAGVERWSGVFNSANRVLNPAVLVLGAGGAFTVGGGIAPSGQGFYALHVTSQRAQSIGFCFGDGSGTACPCSNASSPGDQSGCTNSFGTAAHLADGGIASITSDTLVLTSSGETPSAVTLVFHGTTALQSHVFGDGLRCVGGTIKRLYTKTATAGVVTVPGSGDLSISARSAAQGDVLAAGSKRHYQAMYRDPNPTFCPRPSGSTWNMSSGLVMTWVP